MVLGCNITPCWLVRERNPWLEQQKYYVNNRIDRYYIIRMQKIELLFFFIEHAGELSIFVLREKNEWSKYKRSKSHLEPERRKAEQRSKRAITR